MTWRSTRKLTIVAIILTFFALCGASLYYKYKPLPNCFDGKKNGTETGIDCGGGCLKVCAVNIRPLKSLWARAIEINKGTYTVVALIENNNLNLGTPKASYNVKILNRAGVVIGQRGNTTFINPNEKFVIFETGFNVGSDTPAKVFVDFNPISDWQSPRASKAVLTVTRQDFATDTMPVLQASITNTSVYNLAEVLVPVVISDEAGNAISASATFLGDVVAGESRDLTFTWREPFTAPPAYVDFYPRANSYLLK